MAPARSCPCLLCLISQEPVHVPAALPFPPRPPSSSCRLSKSLVPLGFEAEAAVNRRGYFPCCAELQKPRSAGMCCIRWEFSTLSHPGVPVTAVIDACQYDWFRGRWSSPTLTAPLPAVAASDFPLEAPMPSLSQAQNHANSLPEPTRLLRMSLAQWAAASCSPGAMEQGCRAQPCAEAAPSQPSLKPKAEIAASQFAAHFLYGAQGPCLRQGPGKAPLPLFPLSAGGSGPKGPSTPWSSSTGHTGTGSELLNSGV